MFKTILVPIDIGNASESNTTIDIAAANGNEDSRIILLYVIEEIPKWVAAGLPKGIQEISFKTSQTELTSIAEAANAETEVEVRVGHPYHTILEVAKEKGADLIVIDSHIPGLQDYLLGSTAAKVVRHANCSVLVVRR
jgi:universal stress protein F